MPFRVGVTPDSLSVRSPDSRGIRQVAARPPLSEAATRPLIRRGSLAPCQRTGTILLWRAGGMRWSGLAGRKGKLMYRQLILAAVLGSACLFATAAPAYQLAPSQPPQQAQQRTQTAHDDHLIESGSYVNKAGNTVHRPAHTESGLPPTGASAQCRDGSYSFSQSHSGTCSHHGGVSRWL
jgi:hypothetical protein